MQCFIAFILVLFAINPVLADTEKLKAFDGAPPEIEFNEIETEKLNSNKPVYKTLSTQNGKQTVIAFLVKAPEQEVWKTIKDYSQYKHWIKQVKHSTIYKTDEEDIYVQFKIKHWLLGKYQYYIKHHFASAQQNWATWTLDEDYNSDFLSSVGFWRTYPATNHTDNETQQTYVVYSANVLFKKKKSKLVRNQALKSSLKQASGWVKKHTEK